MSRRATRERPKPAKFPQYSEPPQAPVDISRWRRESTWPTVSRYVYYGSLLLVIVLFGLIRFHLRNLPLDRDEGEYAYGGQLMLQGIPPFQLEYTMKLPGTAAAYAVLMSVFGETRTGIHIGFLLVNTVTTFLVFLLGRRLFEPLAGVIAGASYALFSSSVLVQGSCAQATHFVVLFAAAGVLLLLRALDSEQSWLFFGSGLLFGLAFLMKQHGLAFLAFAAVYVIQQRVMHRKISARFNWKSLVVSEGLLALGGILPFAVTCLVMARVRLFQRFWFWTFQYARKYGSGYVQTRNWIPTLGRLFGHSPAAILGRVTLLLLFSAVLVVIYLWSARARSQAFLTISFFLFSFIAVCPGFYFYRHYFVLILPAVSILVGMIVGCTAEKLWEWRGSLALGAVPIVLFALAFFSLIFFQRRFLFQMNGVQASRYLYQDSPFPEALEIADYIKTHTRENATVAIVGSEAEIFFYSHRHSPTGYIHVYPFLEPQRYALAMQQQMISEIQAARPEVLLYVHVPGSWSGTVEQISSSYIVNWMHQYVQDQFVADGIAEIGDVTQYHWGEAVKDYAPRSQHYVLIYKRKPSS